MKTTIETPVLQDEVQRAVASAPSRQAFADAKAKMEELNKQHASVTTEIARLVKDLSDGKEEPTVRAKDLLEGKPLRECKTVNDLRTARDHKGVIEQAIRLQNGSIQALERQFSLEVYKALRPTLQRTVSRGAAAVKELQGVAKEWPSVRDCIYKAGVTLAGFPPDLVPFSATSQMDDSWLLHIKGLGFTV
jgi:hypothetical protein